MHFTSCVHVVVGTSLQHLTPTPHSNTSLQHLTLVAALGAIRWPFDLMLLDTKATYLETKET
jgi:hypothetical protein